MLVAEILSYTKPPTPESRKKHQEFLRNHGSNGALQLAGKLEDGSGGLVVWNVDSMQKAESLANDDPFVKDGFATFTLKQYGVTFNYFLKPPLVG